MGALAATTPVGASTTVSPVELAQLMDTFNQVTGRLQSTHESLRTEVARLQAELRDANEQLQRSKRLAALGEMAAGIAHEVRNPLGSIRLYARMLEQDLADRPQEMQIASKIAAAVHGLDGVVGDVLSFSREQRVAPQHAEAGELLDRALEACWTQECVAAGVRVVQRDKRRGGGIARGLRAGLWCDALLMHQALVNVIRNGLQAMTEAPAPADGHVLTLDAGPVRGEDGKAMFGIAVTDTGPGIADQTIDRMFNPFFTTRAMGTGLGLAIVHRIVDAHAGRILVRSRTTGAERGTTFQLLLPAAPAGASDHTRKVGPVAAREQTEQETRP
jgi:two-component system sensor histidine kinase FlrB